MDGCIRFIRPQTTFWHLIYAFSETPHFQLSIRAIFTALLHISLVSNFTNEVITDFNCINTNRFQKITLIVIHSKSDNLEEFTKLQNGGRM